MQMMAERRTGYSWQIQRAQVNRKLVVIYGSLFVSVSCFLVLFFHFCPTAWTLKNSNVSIYLWNFPNHIANDINARQRYITNSGSSESWCQVVASSENTTWHSMINSRSDFLQYDAVVFYIPNLNNESDMPRGDYQRPKHQRFIFFTDKSPLSMTKFHPEAFDNYFNWTMSYQKDSDIRFLPGKVIPISNESDAQTVIKPRPNLTKVAWIVSHCSPSNDNEDYVRELRKNITVDIFGSCGNLTTFKKTEYFNASQSIFPQMAENYTYYLSFEDDNSCHEYVSDELFEALRQGIIPIVKGRASFYDSITPPNSTINTALFKSPADLAEYLLRPDTYDLHLAWKKDYDVSSVRESFESVFFNDLCGKLRNAKDGRPAYNHEGNITSNRVVKLHPSLVFQWNVTKQCV